MSASGTGTGTGTGLGTAPGTGTVTGAGRTGPGRLIGVGVGPGDPELVTLKAVRVLREADIVFVPVASSGEPGRAEAVVLAHVDAAPVRRLPFSLDPSEGERDRSWERAAAAVAGALAHGPIAMTAAFATIGDPSVYSTFTYLAERVRALLPGVDIGVVPGITAMQDLAARSGIPLVIGTERLALLPLAQGTSGLAGALADHDTVVCYKGGARLPELLDVIGRAGRLGHAVFGARLGLADECVCSASEMEGHRGPYLSTVIVHPDRPGWGARSLRAEAG
jgi:precorrin-2/cobalt-factor-2 C20-methyltransferase